MNHRSHRAVGALVIGATIALAALPARAQGHPPETRPREIAIPVFQIISGVTLQAAGLTGFVLLADQLEGRAGLGWGLAVLLATPVVEGLAICGIGKLSRHYQGGCGAPIIGAYLGMAAGIGVYFAAHTLLSGNDVFGAGVFLAGPALVATYSWHDRKIPRGENTTALAPERPPERAAFAPRPTRESPGTIAAASVPLFVARF